jgi:hypothetical protein
MLEKKLDKILLSVFAENMSAMPTVKKLELLEQLVCKEDKSSPVPVPQNPVIKRVPPEPVPSYPSTRPLSVVVLGKTFRSLRQAAEYHDIPYHRCNQRRKAGHPVEVIFKEAYEKAKVTEVKRRANI